MLGHEQLGDLARRLRKAARADLRRELVKGIRRPAADIAKQAKANVRALPSRGRSSGLRRRVARTVRVTARSSGAGVGVRIWADPKRMPGGQGNLPRHLDTGRWRHPVFGDRDTWVTQTVPPGWFGRAARDKGDDARREVLDAMRRVRDQLEAGG